MSDDESAGSEEERVSEGELAMRKRRDKTAGDSAGLEDADKELLENNKAERSRMDDEIRELRDRNEKRKKEREVEEKRLAAERAADDARRKADEEERKRKKNEEEEKKKSQRAQKMAEFEKWKNPPKANFVISKRAAADGEEGEDQGEDDGKGKKSKEQLEAEKQAILRQRLKPLDIDGADNAKLTEKAKELHTLLARLEGEKYDLDKRLKVMQQEMMSLAERARQANKVGKDGTVKRVNEDTDRILTRFAGAPSKVEMYSKYERQKDKRTYGDRKVLFTGPMRCGPAERIAPHRIVKWSEEGLPEYEEAGAPPPQQEAA